MNANYRRPWETWPIAHLKAYWAFYLFVGQAIWTLWFANFTLQDHDKRIASLEQRQNSEDVLLTEIKSRLASIDTSIKYIEQTLTKMR